MCYTVRYDWITRAFTHEKAGCMNTDILIVGSGCAGLYAALHLPQDKAITIITKASSEDSDSFLAQGGMCMLKNPGDYDSYFEDTLKAGHYENDKTYAYFKYDNKFIEFEYDFVASRATTILNDVIEYLRGNQYIENPTKKVLK